MNVLDVLNYGHQTVMKTLEGLPADAWETKGVVGDWSVKDIMAHLASYEWVLVEVLQSLVNQKMPTPTLKLMKKHGDFNNQQVALRQHKPWAEVLDEYEHNHARVMKLAQKIPPTTVRQKGVLPWYGAEYDLEDYIVYTFYGHKREHCAQIALFKKHLRRMRD